MGTDLSGAPGTDGKFWDGFLEAVRAQGGRAPYDRWYVIRAEQYLKAYPDTPLSRHRPEEVSAYLTEIGRKGGLKDWQFRQVVDALEALFCKVVVAPWAGRFDWGYWKDSARSLNPHHATIARDVPLSQASGGHDPREADPGLGPLRGTHGEVLHGLIAEIRRRAYSIRTEQAYEHWACRFIGFCRNRNPRELGAAEVGALREWLFGHPVAHGELLYGTEMLLMECVRLKRLVPRLLLVFAFILWVQGNTVVWGEDKVQQQAEAVAEKVEKKAERTEKAEGKNDLVEDSVKVTTDEDGEPVIEQKGEASFYGKGFHGKETASGEKFNQHDHTAAHPTLPLGSEATVTNLETGESVEVEINDRGPYVKGRDIDLSKKAAKEIGLDKEGAVPVKIEAKIPPEDEGKQTDK